MKRSDPYFVGALTEIVLHWKYTTLARPSLDDEETPSEGKVSLFFERAPTFEEIKAPLLDNVFVEEKLLSLFNRLLKRATKFDREYTIIRSKERLTVRVDYKKPLIYRLPYKQVKLRIDPSF